MRQHTARHDLALLVAGGNRPGRGSGDDHQDPQLACREGERGGEGNASIQYARYSRPACGERRADISEMDHGGDPSGCSAVAVTRASATRVFVARACFSRVVPNTLTD